MRTESVDEAASEAPTSRLHPMRRTLKVGTTAPFLVDPAVLQHPQSTARSGRRQPLNSKDSQVIELTHELRFPAVC